MLVEIIHQENENVRRGGFSFIERDQLASWASMTKQEIDDLVSTCGMLHPFTMARDAAKEYAYGRGRKAANCVYMFLLSTYIRYGRDLYLDRIEYDTYLRLCGISASEIYEQYKEDYEAYPVDSSYGTGPMLEKIFLFYLRHFVTAVDEAINRGYDWDVIVKMVTKNFTEEKFRELKDYCAANNDEE